MDLWLQLEITCQQVLGIDRRDTMKLGLSATHLAGYFSERQGAEGFLKALYALRRHKNKFRHKRCKVCGERQDDPNTGIISLRAGHCDVCFKKRFGALL